VKVRIGRVIIGDGLPVAIQSMTNTPTVDVEKTVEQIKNLEVAKVDIVRVAIPDFKSAEALSEIKKRVSVPIVADIHFDHRLAIEAIKNGADKVRINPGNIGARWKVEELAKFARERRIPIRVGSNTGSLPRDLEKYEDRAVALAEAALREVRILEEVGFEDIVVSVKSSDPVETIKANEYIKKRVDYPIHIGVTEAGVYETAVVSSSFALGYLLYKGIGDTIRVSIAGDPVREVIVARKLLSSVGLRREPKVIACPGCARAVFDVERIAERVERKLFESGKTLTFSVLGCYVNGIGEGKHADAGIAGIDSERFVAFKKGEIVGTFPMKYLEKIMEDLLKDL
jgi:(E)-4-hydroxy-3-methylbut-2-enyl-diphosphate synthase